MKRAVVLALAAVWIMAGAKFADALLDAARSDDHAALSALLNQGADVNAREDDGTTALAWAATRSNKDIARRLAITEGTAKTHVKAILTKLDAISRTEAVAVAHKRGMIRL